MHTCVPIMAYSCKAVPLQKVFDPERPYTAAPNHTQKQCQLIVIINNVHKSLLQHKTCISTFRRTYITKPHVLGARLSRSHQRTLTNYERTACSLGDASGTVAHVSLPSIKLTPLSQLFPFSLRPRYILSWPASAYWANSTTATSYT